MNNAAGHELELPLPEKALRSMEPHGTRTKIVLAAAPYSHVALSSRLRALIVAGKSGFWLLT
jgi:hypothetical protein